MTKPKQVTRILMRQSIVFLLHSFHVLWSYLLSSRILYLRFVVVVIYFGHSWVRSCSWQAYPMIFDEYYVGVALCVCLLGFSIWILTRVFKSFWWIDGILVKFRILVEWRFWCFVGLINLLDVSVACCFLFLLISYWPLLGYNRSELVGIIL